MLHLVGDGTKWRRVVYIKLYKEMQTMKKILVVLMAMLTMAVMLAGCGGDSKRLLILPMAIFL